jgi:hypothetical protein
MYFEKFPKILYDFNIGSNIEYRVVTDITRNIRIVKDLLSNITLYDEYDIRDGETPEIIADKFYGSPLYHWIVMMTNDRYDYVNDFPLPTYELEKHVKDVYGDTQYAAHHYEDSRGNVVPQVYTNVYGVTETTYPVSNYEYEERLNESKRRIKIISPQILARVLKSFEEII